MKELRALLETLRSEHYKDADSNSIPSMIDGVQKKKTPGGGAMDLLDDDEMDVEKESDTNQNIEIEKRECEEKKEDKGEDGDDGVFL